MKILNKTLGLSGEADIGQNNSFVRLDNLLMAQLPPLEYLADTVKGGGILGEVNMPTIGQVGAMPVTFSFRNFDENVAKLGAPIARQIVLRWVQDVFDTNNLKTGVKKFKAYIVGQPLKRDSGKVEMHAGSEASVDFEAFVYKEYIDGVLMTEVDKFNNVLKINGVDYMAEIRAAL